MNTERSVVKRSKSAWLIVFHGSILNPKETDYEANLPNSKATVGQANLREFAKSFQYFDFKVVAEQSIRCGKMVQND